MALQGINLPLAFTGQEAVWQKVFKVVLWTYIYIYNSEMFCKILELTYANMIQLSFGSSTFRIILVMFPMIKPEQKVDHFKPILIQ